MATETILVINCGSSSIKFALIDHSSGIRLIGGLAERLGSPEARLSWQLDGIDGSRAIAGADHQVAMEAIVTCLEEAGPGKAAVAAIGHRVVHGGEQFTESTLLDEAVLAVIEACNHLAPLHNPANLLGIRTARRLFPKLPQVAVFDTAFHQTLPRQAYLYAVPYAWYTEQGVRRYGFHGTSHRFVTRKAADLLEKSYDNCALISAHLGNGCSAAAVLNGRSVDTTMGLTPLEGLVMGTRSGDVDPSLPSFLNDQLGYSLGEITNLLNKKSGLLGLSGVSNDMRTLLEAAADGHQRAALAIDVFCYRLAKSLAGMAVALGRIDALIFTGGMGEKAAPIRAKTLTLLALFNFELDAGQNADHGRGNRGIITQPGSTVAMVVPTDEELMIAQDTAALLTSEIGRPGYSGKE